MPEFPFWLICTCPRRSWIHFVLSLFLSSHNRRKHTTWRTLYTPWESIFVWDAQLEMLRLLFLELVLLGALAAQDSCTHPFGPAASLFNTFVFEDYTWRNSGDTICYFFFVDHFRDYFADWDTPPAKCPQGTSNKCISGVTKRFSKLRPTQPNPTSFYYYCAHKTYIPLCSSCCIE